VSAPYNYPFADNLDPTLQTFLQNAFGKGGLAALTPTFGGMMFQATANGLDGKNFLGIPGTYPVSRDIWGPSTNTLLCIQDTTLKVTANGYAVQMRRSDVQQAVHDFTAQFTAMLNQYQRQGSYPINSALEIRVTGLDDPSPVAAGAQSPVISTLAWDQTAVANQWDVALWLDVLTIPGTPGSNDFYTDLEQWLLQRFTGAAGRVMPEWSKAWAYTSTGAWSNSQFIQYVRQACTDGRQTGDNWNWEVTTLSTYDKYSLFSNDFLDGLFATTS
jgi:hypothetical protein